MFAHWPRVTSTGRSDTILTVTQPEQPEGDMMQDESDTPTSDEAGQEASPDADETSTDAPDVNVEQADEVNIDEGTTAADE